MKKFIFKAHKGTVKLTLTAKTQQDAVIKLGSLVQNVSDWPHMRILKIKH